MTRANAVFAAAFNGRRTPRSDAYKAGVMAVLKYRLEDVPIGPMPYAVPSAEADAYWSGADEGHRLAREAAVPVVRCLHCDQQHVLLTPEEYDTAADAFGKYEFDPGVFYVKCSVWPQRWRAA